MGLGFRSGAEYLTVAECVDVSTNNTIVEKSDLVGQWTNSLGHFTWYTYVDYRGCPGRELYGGDDAFCLQVIEFLLYLVY